MPRPPRDPYTRHCGKYYRHSYTKGKKSRYLCSRYLNDGAWTAWGSKSNKRCCGVLIVKKRGDGEEDLVYFEKDHECTDENEGEENVPTKVIVHVPDDRPPLTITNRCMPYYGLSDEKIKSLSKRLEDANGWEPLTGNTNRDRWYFPTLSDNKDLYGEIEQAMAWYVSQIQRRYPGLTIIKYGAIKSAPNAKSQYDGHLEKLHSDYPSIVNGRPSDLRPMSFIVGLDEFDFMWLPHHNAKRDDICTVTVTPGQMIAFTNNCLHAGGANRHSRPVIRIFGYACAFQEDIPLGRVYRYKWSSTNTNANIEEEKDITPTTNYVSTRGRMSKVPTKYQK